MKEEIVKACLCQNLRSMEGREGEAKVLKEAKSKDIIYISVMAFFPPKHVKII